MLVLDKQKILLSMARIGIGKQELLEAAEVSSRTLNDVMTGMPVRPKTLGKVAKALRVDPAELILEDTRNEG